MANMPVTASVSVAQFDPRVKISDKHKGEIEQLLAMGVADGRVFENASGEKRFVKFINFPIGTIGHRAFSEGETIINYEGGSCSIDEWFKWSGGALKESELKDTGKSEPDEIYIMAQAMAARHKKDSAKDGEDKPKWKSHPAKKQS